MKPSHLDEQGAPRMVDVSAKPVTLRSATARATVVMMPETAAALAAAGGPKGDAFVTARLAGISAAKRTADLIPLCHPLPLDHVDVTLAADGANGVVRIEAQVRATARTGVEMEALTAVSIAALTLYDMAKALQRDIRIENVELVHKAGGRSGTWTRESSSVTVPGQSTAAPPREAVIVTCSNRAAAGERADDSGPALVEALAASGWEVAPDAIVVPDNLDVIAQTLAALADAGHRLILTTGGTGLTPSDVTPAATSQVIDREIPGIAERMRVEGGRSTPMAALSRGLAGARGQALIVNLPGSPKAALESLEAIRPVLRHAIEQLAGGDH
jgi:cyclic pyranopterin monophosphate synthase